MFSFEFCEIFRNSYFVKHQQTTTLDCWSFLIHSLKNAQIRSLFWSVFSCIRSKYVYLSVFSLNAGKNGPEKTPYLDTFHVVIVYERSHVSWHQIVAALLENLQQPANFESAWNVKSTTGFSCISLLYPIVSSFFFLISYSLFMMTHINRFCLPNTHLPKIASNKW